MIISIDMKNFIENIKKAFIGKNYKEDFGDKTFWSGLRFVAKITLIQFVVFAITISFLIIPIVKKALERDNLTNFLDTYIPAGAEVNVKDDIVTTGDNKPVFIKLTTKEEEKYYEYVMVIDPNVEEGKELDKFEEYKTISLVTSNKIISLDKENSIVVKPLVDVPDYKINRDTIVALYEKMRPYIFVVVPMIMAVSFAMLYILNLFMVLVVNFFLAAIVLFIAKLKKVKLSYKQSYVIALFANAPIVAIEIIVFLVFGLGFGIFLPIPVIVFFSILNIKKESADMPMRNDLS